MKMNKTTQIWYWLSGRTPDFLCFTKTCDHKHILRSAAIEEWPGCRPGWDPAWTTQIWGPVLWWRPDRPAQCWLGSQSSPWGMETRYDRHASKRSNPSKCNIWQDITPLLVPVKVFCIVLLKGLWRAVDACLRDQQVGFRRQSLEYQQRISLNFINFVKAFDSVHRETLLKIAQAYGIPSWFVDIFRNFYQGSRCCVLMEEGATDLFAIKTCLWQGCMAFYSFSSSTLLPATPSTTYTSAYLEQLAASSCRSRLAKEIIIIVPTQTTIWDFTMALENQASSIELWISGQKTIVVCIGLHKLKSTDHNRWKTSGGSCKLHCKINCGW